MTRGEAGGAVKVHQDPGAAGSGDGGPPAASVPHKHGIDLEWWSKSYHSVSTRSEWVEQGG